MFVFLYATVKIARIKKINRFLIRANKIFSNVFKNYFYPCALMIQRLEKIKLMTK